MGISFHCGITYPHTQTKIPLKWVSPSFARREHSSLWPSLIYSAALRPGLEEGPWLGVWLAWASISAPGVTYSHWRSCLDTPRPSFLKPKALILHLSMVLGTACTDKNSTAMTRYPQNGEHVNNRAKCEDGSKFWAKPDAGLPLLSEQPHWTLGSVHRVIMSWVIPLVLCHPCKGSVNILRPPGFPCGGHHKNREVRDISRCRSVHLPALLDMPPFRLISLCSLGLSSNCLLRHLVHATRLSLSTSDYFLTMSHQHQIHKPCPNVETPPSSTHTTLLAVGHTLECALPINLSSLPTSIFVCWLFHYCLLW